MGLKFAKPADEGYTQLNDTRSAFDKHPINQPDVPETEHKVYRRRYYILIMFSVASILQILIWNTWAPIANTAITVLGWTQADIALLSMWGGIISAFFCIPFAGIMDKFGLRILFLLAETLGLIGAAIRCIPVPIEYLKWTANFGQFFIALAGPFLVQGPSLMSAAWFPPSQRTTATAVAQTSMGAGVALSFVLGPLLVKDTATISPDTLVQNQTDYEVYGNALPDEINPLVKQKRIDEIYRMLYMECILLAIMCAAAWIYYPATPPTPPSVSASKTREDFLPGLKILVRSGNAFWLPAIAYGVIIGVPGTWATQLVIMFQGTVGLSQDTVSWIAFYTYIGGVLGALAASRLVLIDIKATKVPDRSNKVDANGINSDVCFLVFNAMIRQLPSSAEYNHSGVV